MAADQRVTVIATFVPHGGHEGDVEQILRAMVGPSRAEAGCEAYDLYRSETGFALYERYRDADALDHHRGTEHYTAYRAAIADHLAEPIGVSRLQALDTVG
jgi:quinol monooxygenase YgiN